MTTGTGWWRRFALLTIASSSSFPPSADPKRYVQFACQSGVLDAEAPGADVVVDAKEQIIADAGWSAPGAAQPNWTSSLELPALTTEYKALAAVA